MTSPSSARPLSARDSWLLDVPLLQAGELVALEADLAELFGTGRDIVPFGSEATLALEAIAANVGRPGQQVLNLVTGPYGALFGTWLADAGSTVRSLEADPHRAVSVAAVADALAERPTDVLCVVHAEAATGIVNDLPAISALARQHGALTVVDAVASVGAEPLAIDEWDLDLVAIGPQKSLSGPVGISVATVSDRAWELLASRQPPIRQSSLAMLDWKDGWLDSARTAIPGYLPILETRALAAAAARALGEGINAIVGRHRSAAAATRAGIMTLGLAPWATAVEDAAGVATVVAVPDGVIPTELVAAARDVNPSRVEVAPAGLREVAIRVSHTGRSADWASVAAAVTALQGALAQVAPDGHRGSLGDALAAAHEGWRGR